MSDTSPEFAVEFKGKGGEECEEFIKAIRKRAFEAGRIRDNDWIVDFASTCFSGRALRWYESLDSEIQGDWARLRKAMLDKYPPESDDDSEPSSAISPVPAAAPPHSSQPVSRRAVSGRLLVRTTDRSWAYITGVPSTNSDVQFFGCVKNSSDRSASLPLKKIQVDERLALVNDNGEYIGLVWANPKAYLSGSYGDRIAALVFVSSEGAVASTEQSDWWRGGRSGRLLFEEGPQGSLMPSWSDPEGGIQNLEVKTRAYSPLIVELCHVGSTWLPEQSWKLAKFVWEEM